MLWSFSSPLSKAERVGKVKIIWLNESFIAPVGGKHNWLNGFKVHLKNIHDSLKFIFSYHKTTQNLSPKEKEITGMIPDYKYDYWENYC